jgi:hypothetical protein
VEVVLTMLEELLVKTVVPVVAHVLLPLVLELLTKV